MTPYLQAKVAKAIEDALMADDRVLSVEQFSFARAQPREIYRNRPRVTSSEFEFGGEAA
ncbi:MAG: hypothetical protein ACLUT5_12720 [Butyricicoccus sp.]